MIEHLVIAVVALLAAVLSFFSGFGLGTVLLPAFALFMPAEAAVAATAVVHLFNGVFKLSLVFRHVDRKVLWRFGVPALFAAIAGAALLVLLGDTTPLARYTLLGREAEVSVPGLVIGGLMVAFAVVDLSPRVRRAEAGRRWLPLGGVVSGFFGGLSGHQGALRATFLVRAGLDAKSYVATTAACSALVDVVRLLVYFLGALALTKDYGGLSREQAPLLVTGCVAALAGALLGARLLKKVTMDSVRTIVAILLISTGAALMSGLL